MSLAELIIRRVTRRPPDFLVGGQDNPYLRRWWVIPRNPVFNIYLHQFLRDDDDRALHDHPWAWCSILLRGSYIEHTIAAGGIQHRQQRNAPSIKFSGPRRAHRIELLTAHDRAARLITVWSCWTLFITGPRVREWGFHCPKGWVPWKRFTAADDKGAIGAGCGNTVTVPRPLIEQRTAQDDMRDFGIGFTVDGKRVAPERVCVYAASPKSAAYEVAAHG